MKQPYQYISKVEFSGTDDFPNEVVFNPNLNSVIGSRSSGKTALLAYIAFSVDPDETVKTQVEAYKHERAELAGPAAGKTWADVANIKCKVVWGSNEVDQGKVIYIPQNSLYEISEYPDKITQKITPALFRVYPEVETAYGRMESTVNASNETVEKSVGEWFSLAKRVDAIKKKIREIGDKKAIGTERDRLQCEINSIKLAAKLTDEEVSKYQEVTKKLQCMDDRVSAIGYELEQFSSYVVINDASATASTIPSAVQVSIKVRPAETDLPDSTAAKIAKLREAFAQVLKSQIEELLAKGAVEAFAERFQLLTDAETMRTENAGLIKKHQANEKLALVVENHEKQISSLEEIKRQESAYQKLIDDQNTKIVAINKALMIRSKALEDFAEIFCIAERKLDKLTFGIEAEVPDEVADMISVGVNRKRISNYSTHSGDSVDYEKAQSDPGAFLMELHNKHVVLNKSYLPQNVASEILTTTKWV